MTDPVIVVSDDDEDSQGSVKTVYTGVFSIFNARQSTPSMKEGRVVDRAELSAVTVEFLAQPQLSIFYQSDSSTSDFIFGPLRMGFSSPPFAGVFVVDQNSFTRIQRGMRALGFCVTDANLPCYFWPWRFDLYVNRQKIARPEARYNRESANYWMDISSALRLGSNQVHVHVQQPRSDAEFFFSIRLFQPQPDQIFVHQVMQLPHWTTADWTCLFRQAMNPDSEVEFSKLVMSLICPLGLQKIVIPVRGINCRHLCCVDLTAFVEYQREVADWKCPICDEPCHLSDLRVDDCLSAILDSVPLECESVEVTELGEVKK
jgi:hypothetical protein